MLISAVLMLSASFAGACDSSAKDDSSSAEEWSGVKTFYPDTGSNLKNPYMGWTLYSEGTDNTDRPQVYWALQDEAAQKYAGVYYIRWRWSDMEPEEGKYAWEYNEDFKGLVQGALDRGLRLAFRVYVNGRDNLRPATPQYVLDGAETYTVSPGHQTPYPDDGFFLEKYTKFIEAFGREFNDPSRVDYVDSYGLGWWGEEHNIQWKDPARRHQAHDRIVKAYEKAFDKVINVINFGVRDDYEDNIVYNDLGFTPRRDGYASEYFPESQQEELAAHFPHTPVVAEACYWRNDPISSYENGKWSTWSSYYHDVVDLAVNTHANYLDLRTPTETDRYLEDALDEVKRFISLGGYRIYPEHVKYRAEGGNLVVEHTWVNIANGVLPNNNVHMRYKYKVSLALFDEEDNIVSQILSDGVEVSELVGDRHIMAEDTIDIAELPSGSYRLGIAIVNTIKNDSEDIRLAVKDPDIITGEWVYVADVAVDGD